MMSRYTGENKNKTYFIFFSYSPLQMLTLKTCNKDISKKLFKGRSFKLGQLIEDDDKVTW